jgi:hypothetical protein
VEVNHIGSGSADERTDCSKRLPIVAGRNLVLQWTDVMDRNSGRDEDIGRHVPLAAGDFKVDLGIVSQPQHNISDVVLGASTVELGDEMKDLHRTMSPYPRASNRGDYRRVTTRRFGSALATVEHGFVGIP